jgi:hypothetical protein
MVIPRMTLRDSAQDLNSSSDSRPPARKLAASEKPASELPRSEFLKLVQEKIRKGYYNSEPVIDDLSSSFAGAFDKIV